MIGSTERFFEWTDWPKTGPIFPIFSVAVTRRPGETLLIETPAEGRPSERITVTVLEVKGNQVRIGTDAPDDIAIVRAELLEPATT